MDSPGRVDVCVGAVAATTGLHPSSITRAGGLKLLLGTYIAVDPLEPAVQVSTGSSLQGDQRGIFGLSHGWHGTPLRATPLPLRRVIMGAHWHLPVLSPVARTQVLQVVNHRDALGFSGPEEVILNRVRAAEMSAPATEIDKPHTQAGGRTSCQTRP